MSSGVKKLQEEYKLIRRKGIGSIGGSAGPINKNNFLHWSGSFIGPKGSPYEGGLFYFEMKFTNDYPNSPPIDVQMRTPIYHPNISSSNGHICVDYLNEWKPTNNIAGIFYAIFDILNTSNPGSSYNSTNIQKSKDYTNKYAIENQEIDWNNSWDKGWNN